MATAEQARRALAKALKRQAQRLEKADAEAVAVQLLGQVTPDGEWPKLLAHWERRNPAGVAGWPRRLEIGSCALNLWPLAAGRVEVVGLGGDVRKRQPRRLLCTPGLTTFDPRENDDSEATALAVVCATWLDDVGLTDFQALRLAPPILETWGIRGRLISRRTVDFALPWSLPADTGV